jgi:peptidoglycan/LPS O-acetylase OafA/YrhL
MTEGAHEPARAPGEVRSIQYLRGFAAFGVLVFHAAERAARSAWAPRAWTSSS